MAEHMLLRDRKAYLLLSSYVHAVRTVAPDASPEDLDALRVSVNTLARQAAKEDVTEGRPQEPLDEFLVRTVGKAGVLVATQLDPEPIPASAARVLKAWKSNAHRFKCSDCAEGPICNGYDTDDNAIVTAQGRCIDTIKTAIADARRLTDDAYGKYVPKVPLPDLVFDTTALADPPKGIPVEGLAVNGMTTYHDGDAGKVSKIDVQVATTAITRLAMAALPYMLMHEVFCHGYQMAAHDGARPGRDDRPDPISEGMADAAAMAILDREARRLGIAPGTVEEGNLKTARYIHGARANLDLAPVFPEASWVKKGATAAEMVEHLYKEKGKGSAQKAADDTVALTVALNAAGWNFASRNKGLSKMLKGLTDRPRDRRLMDLLLEFRRKRTVAELVDHLTRN